MAAKDDELRDLRDEAKRGGNLRLENQLEKMVDENDILKSKVKELGKVKDYPRYHQDAPCTGRRRAPRSTMFSNLSADH